MFAVGVVMRALFLCFSGYHAAAREAFCFSTFLISLGLKPLQILSPTLTMGAEEKPIALNSSRSLGLATRSVSTYSTPFLSNCFLVMSHWGQGFFVNTSMGGIFGAPSMFEMEITSVSSF